jgi:uncharacterized OB-fold protein
VTIRCDKCGHAAEAPRAIDIVGRDLRCSKCGSWQPHPNSCACWDCIEETHLFFLRRIAVLRATMEQTDDDTAASESSEAL